MKNLNFILIAILLVTGFYSCKKEKSEESFTPKTITAKWVVSDVSEFKSFEFNESGTYIIVINSNLKSTTDSIVFFGTYTIIGDSTINLADFGTIKFSKIGETTASFTLKLAENPTYEISINALKQAEIEGSAKTNLLCRTWELVSVNGAAVAGTDMELTVLFSKAGTYFVSFDHPSDYNDGGLAQWKWNDNAETQILYSWDEIPDWEYADHVDVQEVTSGSLKIVEDELLYLLKPVAYTKSAQIKLSQTRHINGIKSSLFKK